MKKIDKILKKIFPMILAGIVGFGIGMVLIILTTPEQPETKYESAYNIRHQLEHPITIWKQSENDKLTTWVVIDESTGIHYIAVSGNLDQGISIYPRLKTDGTYYTVQDAAE